MDSHMLSIRQLIKYTVVMKYYSNCTTHRDHTQSFVELMVLLRKNITTATLCLNLHP